MLTVFPFLLQRRSSGDDALDIDSVSHVAPWRSLAALLDRSVYAMPLRAFRPPNEPLRYSGMLLRYFDALQVRARGCGARGSLGCTGGSDGVCLAR